jgi:NAD(P) transhydrogenase subunit beta
VTRAYVQLAYLAAASLFILGLRFLSSPRTARLGNSLSMLGMLVAVVVTLLDRRILDYTWIVAGLLAGSAIGAVMGRRVKLTAMPQMVGLLNAFGGGASALVVLAEFLAGPRLAAGPALITGLGMFIGVMTFTGSLSAFGKLQGILRSSPVVFPGQRAVNLLLHLAILAAVVLVGLDPFGRRAEFLYLVLGLSAVLGVTLVLPIGGADMPVIISLLNSYSGLAAAAGGFVLGNAVLIVSGALVGATGLILSTLMCRAMNRSLLNVLFGAAGLAEGPAAEAGRRVTRYTPADAAAMLESADSVIVVPGYGLAVSQAQHVLQEAVSILQARGSQVRYAIHPVAGRMPGHMNVLLAEANVPYELLKDMEEINEEFAGADVVLVVGANDVVNPAAREKGNPLSGMPILQADRARCVLVLKRSLAPGVAGVDNPLFYQEKTMMVFGDAKELLQKVVGQLKAA